MPDLLRLEEVTDRAGLGCGVPRHVVEAEKILEPLRGEFRVHRPGRHVRRVVPLRRLRGRPYEVRAVATHDSVHFFDSGELLHRRCGLLRVALVVVYRKLHLDVVLLLEDLGAEADPLDLLDAVLGQAPRLRCVGAHLDHRRGGRRPEKKSRHDRRQGDAPDPFPHRIFLLLSPNGFSSPPADGAPSLTSRPMEWPDIGPCRSPAPSGTRPPGSLSAAGKAPT